MLTTWISLILSPSVLIINCFRQVHQTTSSVHTELFLLVGKHWHSMFSVEVTTLMCKINNNNTY